MRYSNEKLLNELSDQDVLGVDRLQKKVNGVLLPIPILFLTFDWDWDFYWEAPPPSKTIHTVP